ncbi:hypothetical protein JCM19992_21470 [Thermostilla marina]
MAEGRQHEQWNHTSHLLAMLYNAFRGHRQRALGPADFHPLAEKPSPKVTLKQLVEMGVFKKTEGRRL